MVALGVCIINMEKAVVLDVGTSHPHAVDVQQ